jgi:hypothetical protein
MSLMNIREIMMRARFQRNGYNGLITTFNSMTILSEEAASSIRLLQSWIESQMAYSGQPGLSVAILNDKEIIWSKGYGYADLENRIKAAPETIYRIASITKLFTSTAVMQLRDQGKLNLHARILYGVNDHHKAEALFKALGRALDMATRIEERIAGELPSTKELLEG